MWTSQFTNFPQRGPSCQDVGGHYTSQQFRRTLSPRAHCRSRILDAPHPASGPRPRIFSAFSRTSASVTSWQRASAQRSKIEHCTSAKALCAYREQGSRLFRVEGSTRGNDLLSEELEEGQVDYEESVASEAHSDAASARSHASGVSFGAASARSYGSTTMSPPRRVLRSSNPFVERYNPVHALRDAPPLTSRYEED
ncbi:hypothetical protein PC119_g9453 [Phytophthora cactorum]|uniref:Uncharacterized protein n=1 Tax=Phytophthora cactorum TaxID=29920 RepID=A0A8T1CFN2_9STRA|nr:hypothetical protein PC114_g13743 [Phytophthora cactorum]KAG2920595.1 hypothetical protein PC117_g16450 [Phytophthora cactorum]KAG3021900.1 hypothetical protein PC119_g9453 [Phytophthora cactorum]KAG3179914.1 hypothetical protein PC128_g15785 [Phytophthora cactorum]